MNVRIQGDLEGVPLNVVQTPDEGLVSGWYYEVPLAPEDKVHPNEVRYAGPYRSKFDATIAALDFLRDALTDHNAPQYSHQFAVLSNPDSDFVPRDAGDDMA